MLHSAASRVGALDMSVSHRRNRLDLGAMEVVYLLGADDFNVTKISPQAFVIYQGHHGDAGAHRADLILPGAAYTEKDGLYVNTEGRLQAAPPGDRCAGTGAGRLEDPAGVIGASGQDIVLRQHWLPCGSALCVCGRISGSLIVCQTWPWTPIWTSRAAGIGDSFRPADGKLLSN